MHLIFDERETQRETRRERDTERDAERETQRETQREKQGKKQRERVEMKDKKLNQIILGLQDLEWLYLGW